MTTIELLQKEYTNWIKDIYKFNKNVAVKEGYLEKEDVKDLRTFTRFIDDLSPDNSIEDMMYGAGLIQGLRIAIKIVNPKYIIK